LSIVLANDAAKLCWNALHELVAGLFCADHGIYNKLFFLKVNSLFNFCVFCLLAAASNFQTGWKPELLSEQRQTKRLPNGLKNDQRI
jgi:hypothetical protein